MNYNDEKGPLGTAAQTNQKLVKQVAEFILNETLPPKENQDRQYTASDKAVPVHEDTDNTLTFYTTSAVAAHFNNEVAPLLKEQGVSIEVRKATPDESLSNLEGRHDSGLTEQKVTIGGADNIALFRAMNEALADLTPFEGRGAAVENLAQRGAGWTNRRGA